MIDTWGENLDAESAAGTMAGPVADPSSRLLPLLTLEWAARDQIPKLIIDHQQRLLWHNAAAKADLRQQRVLQVRSGALTSTEPGQQALLSRFLTACSDELATLCLPGGKSDAHLLLRAQVIGKDEETRYVGVTYTHTGKNYKARYVELESAFSLTQAEHRVLLQMTEGCTADEIGRRIGVSVETVRSQIRGIYAKLGVASREALFNRVQPFRL